MELNNPYRDKTILLTEDDELTALIEKKELELKGYKVFHAPTGEDAVRIISSNDRKIDLVLMDIDLGKGMDGTEAARKILDILDIPIVFLSAHMETEIVEKTEMITSYGYVIKNSGPVILDTSIKMAFRLFYAKQEEKRQKEFLQISEKKYKMMVNHYPGIVLIQNLDGSIYYVNYQTELILGYTPDELKKMNVLEHIHHEDQEKVSLKHQDAFSGKEFKNFEYRFVHKNNKIVWLSHSARTVYLNHEMRYVQSYIEDITERKLTEESLKESELKFRRLFENMMNAVVIYEAAADGKDFIIMDMNGSSERIEQVNREDVLGKKVTEVFPGVIEFGLLDVFQRVWKTGKAESFPLSFYQDNRISGWRENYIYKISSGEIVAVYKDITEKKKIEEALKVSEKKYRRIVESAMEGIWIIDNHGNTIFTNKMMNDILGYSESEMRGKSFLDFMDKKAKQEAMIFMDRRKQGISEKHDFRFQHKNGSDVWTILSTNPIYGENGDFKAAMAMVIDITKRKKAEEELQKSQALLALTERLAKVGGWEWNVDKQLMSWTDEVYRIHGLDPGKFTSNYNELVNGSIVCYDPEDRPILLKAFEECISQGTPYDYEFPFTDYKGRRFWIYTMARAEIVNGEIKKIRGLIADITEIKKARDTIKNQLEEKDLILREVHHRIKNNISSIGILLKMQLESINNQEAVSILKDAISRIESSRLIYDKLLLTGEFQKISAKNYLEDLTKAVIRIFPDHQKIQLIFQIEDMEINAKELFSLGLIVNELVTNSMKYAFLNRNHGIISILFEKKDKTIQLIVQDNGNGFPGDKNIENSNSFGLVLVKMLAQQLHGEYEIFHDSGVKFVFHFSPDFLS